MKIEIIRIAFVISVAFIAGCSSGQNDDLHLKENKYRRLYALEKYDIDPSISYVKLYAIVSNTERQFSIIYVSERKFDVNIYNYEMHTLSSHYIYSNLLKEIDEFECGESRDSRGGGVNSLGIEIHSPESGVKTCVVPVPKSCRFLENVKNNVVFEFGDDKSMFIDFNNRLGCA